MTKIYNLVLILFFPIFLTAQDYYFPPLLGDDWETVTPTDAGFCTDGLAVLSTFLAEKNTKAFVVLKDGKIVIEEYFDTFTQDSAWYWASSAKTLTGFLVGVAQEEQLLNIDDKTSDYLGTGWTSAPQAKEDLITIEHQLAMNTGLADTVADLNCLEPSCLNYLTDAGDRWSYYNAPYRLLQDVVESASGLSFQSYTTQKLFLKTGMTGLWNNYVFFSKPRSMARFGSLILNQGNWDGTQVLGDTEFMNDMVNTANDFNASYGYLWWLNGKGSYMLPTLQNIFDTDLVPNAPDEMYSALGKNDQKLYILPSQKIVIVRMGNDAGASLLAVSSFDNELWGHLSDIICDNTNSTDDFSKSKTKVFPNPVHDILFFENKDLENRTVRVFNSIGQQVKNEIIFSNQLNVSDLPKGTYFLQILNADKEEEGRSSFVKI